MSKRSHDEEPVDVLAAEVFPVGDAADPEPGEPPHDVLAADEFAVPGPDPELLADDHDDHDHDDHDHVHDHEHGHAHTHPRSGGIGLAITPKLAKLGGAAVGGALVLFRLVRRGRRRRQADSE